MSGPRVLLLAALGVALVYGPFLGVTIVRADGPHPGTGGMGLDALAAEGAPGGFMGGAGLMDHVLGMMRGAGPMATTECAAWTNDTGVSPESQGD